MLAFSLSDADIEPRKHTYETLYDLMTVSMLVAFSIFDFFFLDFYVSIFYCFCKRCVIFWGLSILDGLSFVYLSWVDMIFCAYETLLGCLCLIARDHGKRLLADESAALILEGTEQRRERFLLWRQHTHTTHAQQRIHVETY